MYINVKKKRFLNKKIFLFTMVGLQIFDKMAGGTQFAKD
jgi:hypothetical protein